MYKVSSFAVFVSLAVFFTVMVSLVSSRTPAPTSCADLSYSCAKCLNSTFNCRYAWVQPGLYNSPENATCLPADTLKTLLYNNQYTQRVYAYALSQAELGTTRGQYLLSMGPLSSLNFNASAVPCYDKQLCYCKVPPPPPPSNITIIITDCRNGNPIPQTATPQATLINRDNNTSDSRPVTDTVSASVNYVRVAVGNYSISGTATGYSVNTTTIPEVGLNQTYVYRLCVTPLPCTVTLRVVDALTQTVLPGAPVTFTTPAGPFSGNTSIPAGTISFSYIAEGGVSSASASYPNYSPNSLSGITCALGGNNTYTIPLSPLPGNLLVLVLDWRTNLPIPLATVTTVAVTSTATTNTTGYVYYTGLGENTYRAFASATGYSSNSSLTSVFLSKGTTQNLTVYLVELPCTVTVNVLNAANNLPISAAIAGLNNTLFQQTTPASGSVTFSIFYDAANASYAIKPSFLFVSASPNPDGRFFCTRGGNQTVTIVLREVIQIFVQAIEALTLDPIPNATISIPSTTSSTSLDPLPFVEGSRFVHFIIVSSLPQTYSISSTALGFLDAGPFSFTFTNASRFQNISMTSVAFTVFIIPYEVTQDTSGNIIPQLPDVDGYVDTNNPLVNITETQRSTVTSLSARRIRVGGTSSRNDGQTSLPSAFSRIAQNDVSSGTGNPGLVRWFFLQQGRNFYGNEVDDAKNPLPFITFPNSPVAGVSGDAYIGDVYASSFASISPSSISKFLLSLGITGYAPNLDVRRVPNYTSSTLLELKIPGYAETQFRTLLFYLPSKLAQTYFLIFVYPFSNPTTKLATFPASNSGSNNINLGVGNSFLTSSVVNFQNKVRLVHEFPLSVGVFLPSITVTVQEPPFSRSLSCWVNPIDDTRLVTASGGSCTIPSNINIPGSFPPQSYFDAYYINNNNDVPPSNQRIRKSGSPNYVAVNYGLVISGGKRDGKVEMFEQHFP